MERFYEPVSCQGNITRVRRILGNPRDEVGPVHTNYPAEGEIRPRLIVIFESPSYEEVERGYPMVGWTGLRVLNFLAESRTIDVRDKPRLHDFYSQHYGSLAGEFGVYLTNLVRYQADHGLRNVDPNTRLRSKNARVKRLWRISRVELLGEMSVIRKQFSQCPVLVATGRAFLPEVKELVAELVSLGMEWYITKHPSRAPADCCRHYNPANWNREGVPRCKMMDGVSSSVQRRRRSAAPVCHSQLID